MTEWCDVHHFHPIACRRYARMRDDMTRVHLHFKQEVS